jgi:hypothetical protein
MILITVMMIAKQSNPSASNSIRCIDLRFVTCCRPLYVVYLAVSDGAHLNPYIIRKLMVRFFWNFSTEILKLYRCSKIIAIASVIDLRVIHLNAIFQAKAHITYLANVHLSFLFTVLWAHNTPPLWFWFFSFGCHFSQKMSDPLVFMFGSNFTFTAWFLKLVLYEC